MFNTITWETFFNAILLLAGGYYAITTLLLFSPEIIQWFKPKSLALSTAAPPDASTSDHDAIMGSVSAEEDWLARRTSLVNSQDIEVSDEVSDEMPDTIMAPGESDLITGTVSDLMQEIKTLLQMADEYKSSKEEMAPLFIALFERYPNLKNTAHAQAISRHICEEGKSKFSFDLELLEVRTWWEGSPN